MGPVRVTIWNEFIHERQDDRVRAIHPDGIHRTMAHSIAPLGSFAVRTATLEEPERAGTR